MENNYSNNHTENTFQESIPSQGRALLDSSKNNFEGLERQSVRRLSRMSLFSLAIAILLAIVVASDLMYIKSLRAQLTQRESIIESLIQNDTTGINSYLRRDVSFTANGKTMDSDEFVTYINSVLQDCYSKLDSLSYYRQYYLTTQSIFGSKLEVNPKDSTGQSYIYTYPAQIQDVNTINKLLIESGRYRAIMKKYPINIEDGDGYFIISSPQIDSALILLPYFRDNLRAISDDKWEITHYQGEKSTRRRRDKN